MNDRSEKRSKPMNSETPSWLTGLLIAGAAVAVLYFEKKRPLRRTRQNKKTRNVRNLAMSVMTAATIRATEKPLTSYIMKKCEQKRIGLFKMIEMPVWAELLLSVALLDYTLYIWHYLTHKVPLLWRLHQVHHVDLDLDASTALRFHPVEMLLSAPWRGAQVLLFGVSPMGLAIWQTATLLEIMFHHSNMELPIEFEKKLCRLIVTPRMHGIHHSIVHEETDSNWSTIFTWPDYVHGTFRLNVPHDKITIGVPAFQDPDELDLGDILKMPATADRPGWRGAPERDPENRVGSRFDPTA